MLFSYSLQCDLDQRVFKKLAKIASCVTLIGLVTQSLLVRDAKKDLVKKSERGAIRSLPLLRR